MTNVLASAAPVSQRLTPEQVAEVIAHACPAAAFREKRVLVIVPDSTRTAPVGLLFRTLHAAIGGAARKLDVMIALGTHQPMSEVAICARLEISIEERRAQYRGVEFINHEWDNPAALKEIGVITGDETSRLTEGLFTMDVPVEINRRVFEYDQIIIIGPVFPHEVVGFSGGNKYLFPGVAGPRILNFFHWLGAVVTNPMIIGNKWTPVRRVVDRAGAMVRVPKLCFCMVVAPDKSLGGLFAGTPEGAWDRASELSRQVHITRKERPFRTILSCAQPMYDELWTGGKAMYKLEPVLADGGELIIYAPHITEVCISHGKVLLEVGYHCRDYFLKQWDKFKGYPWGVLAHSTHVYGLGTFDDGVEIPRARVTLATGIPEAVCQRINLGYRDPKSIRVEDYANREDDGVLLVPNAGEMLFQLKQPPGWAGVNEIELKKGLLNARRSYMKSTIAWILFAACISAMAATNDSRPAPLFNDLGRHHHPVTTKSKLAQRYFDQGFILLYGFNHNEAIRSFEGAAKVDPDCAMAWWGVAYAYGPNINMPMLEPAVPKAWNALQKAIALRDKASPKEQAYIDALSKRYAQDPPKDRAPLDRAYTDAMREVAKQYPDDLDAQTLFAEALMDTSPWNYWLPDLTPKPNAKEALDVIESVLARVRQHPGADHLYIHLVEAGPSPEKGVKSADRLGKFAPGAGHLVHMPSHIYVRVGRYDDATTANVKASLSDESYLAQCLQQGMYPGGYYPHNVHFLWFANDLEGRSQDSIKAAKKLSAYTTELRCGAIEGPRQRYLHLLAFARFGKWDDILKDPAPGADFPFDLAMWHYARGLALAAKGQAAEAAQQYTKFAELEKSEKVRAMDHPYFPGTKMLAIANEVLAGKVAGARGATDEMLSHLRKAVELQDAMPYMEPPYWYYSTRQSLGAALLKSGKPLEAEQIFRTELKHFPNCGWALFGLEQSLRDQGQLAEAKKVQSQFKRAWKRADVQPDLAWF